MPGKFEVYKDRAGKYRYRMPDDLPFASYGRRP